MKRFKPADYGPKLARRFSILFFVGLLAASGPPAGASAEWPPAPPLAVTADDQSGPLPPSVTAGPAARGRWRCTFRFKPAGPAKSVSLAGTFNGWNPSATPMKGPDEAGFWSGTVELGPGQQQYKFVVDGQRWFADPQNPEGTSDNHGGQNSVLRLGRLAWMQASEAQRGDGKIDVASLEHRPDAPLCFQALAPARVLVRYRTLAHDMEHVWLAVKGGTEIEMHVVSEDPVYTLYEAEAALPAPATRQANVHTLTYTFVLSDGGQRVCDPQTYSASFTDAGIFSTPDWAKNAVWYQVFLDRFRNGNPGNDLQPVRPWTSAWFAPSPWEEKEGQTFYKYYVYFRFYGGDLDGLEAELPYLQGLGVNALYLNPIFEARSNHKYDTTNYLHVDEHFGTAGDCAAVAASEDLLDPSTWKWTASDRRFLAFLKKAHELGFHVILDGVFNHVGTAHPAFQDIEKNGQKSRYADWFNVTSWEPFEYHGWAGVRDLPEFKKSAAGLASPSATAHLLAVTRRWMNPDGDGNPSDGIDGWRLDVPNEIPAPFWVEWRKLVKSINPDAYISGEIWDRADPWLAGRHFDAVINYEFARAVVAWVFDRQTKIKASEFDRRLRELRLAYPAAATYALQNLLDSHDTDRAASMALNPDRGYDQQNRVQDNGPSYNDTKPPPEAYAKVRLAALLQMTYVGAPMIYYGDEAGMWGADDPTCRKPMLWKDLEPYEKPEENFVMTDQLAFYRQAIALRRAHPALRTGAFQTLLADDAADVWAFLRWDPDEQLVVALNASSQARTVIVTLPPDSPRPWKGVFGIAGTFSAKGGQLEVQVPALGGVVLYAPTPK